MSVPRGVRQAVRLPAVALLALLVLLAALALLSTLHRASVTPATEAAAEAISATAADAPAPRLAILEERGRHVRGGEAAGGEGGSHPDADATPRAAAWPDPARIARPGRPDLPPQPQRRGPELATGPPTLHRSAS